MPSVDGEPPERKVADAIVLERAARVLERYGWQDTLQTLLVLMAGELRREADRERD